MTAPDMTAPSFENAAVQGDHISDQGIPTRGDIVFHVGSEVILGLGFIGAADIAERAASADVTIEGILTSLAGAGISHLSDLDDQAFTLILNGGSNSKSCNVTLAVITSINYTFTANADCTTAWGYLGTPGAYTGGSGSGVVAWGDKGPTVQGEEVLTGDTDGITSAVFDATIDHEEFYVLGYRDPLRPVTHPYTVTVTFVGLLGKAMGEFVSTWGWTTGGVSVPGVGPCSVAYARPADGGLSVDTGAIPMVTATFNALDFSC